MSEFEVSQLVLNRGSHGKKRLKHVCRICGVGFKNYTRRKSKDLCRHHAISESAKALQQRKKLLKEVGNHGE